MPLPIRSGSVCPAIPRLGDVEETHDTAKRLPVTARASLAPRLARNRGTGRASHLLGTCLQPSLLACISLSDCTPFRQFWDRIKEMTALRKRVSIVQMKHPKQSKLPPPIHPSASAAPSYHRILVKHGLIEKTLSIPDAYKVFLKVGADPEVEKLRRKVAHGNRMKHVPALYLATAMALQSMTKQELESLKLRI